MIEFLSCEEKIVKLHMVSFLKCPAVCHNSHVELLILRFALCSMYNSPSIDSSFGHNNERYAELSFVWTKALYFHKVENFNIDFS